MPVNTATRAVHGRRSKSKLAAVVVASAIGVIVVQTGSLALTYPRSLNLFRTFPRAIHIKGRKASSTPQVSDSYQHLVDVHLNEGVDLKVLQKELLGDTWSDHTLPLELLHAGGATDIDVKPWQDGSTRMVSYKLPVLPGVMQSSVDTAYTIRAVPDTSVSVELVSVTHAPLVKDYPVHTLYTVSKEGSDMRLHVSGFVDWTTSLPAAVKYAIERGIQKTQRNSIEPFRKALARRMRT